MGFYVTGHPLDKYRGIIDTDRYCQLGLLDDLELGDPRARFPFAGMIRSIEHRTTKAGKPFGILVIEDFTGSAEVMCWSESYLPAREAGILEAGAVISLKGAVSIDDRTEKRRVTGTSLKEVRLSKGSNRRNGKDRAPVELLLWLARSDVADLEAIHGVLTSHPGKTPVLLHLQNGTGRRATIQCGEQFRVEKSEQLEQALGRWLGE